MFITRRLLSTNVISTIRDVIAVVDDIQKAFSLIHSARYTSNNLLIELHNVIQSEIRIKNVERVQCIEFTSLGLRRA